MGYGPDDLGGLRYLSFPTLAALDSPRGGDELLAAVRYHEAEVVIVDTVSRTIAGEENGNDTWLGFYRNTGLKLKQEGVALVRLDHAGKDESKGQRGASAKDGDVDAVWHLTRVSDTTYRLQTHGLNRFPLLPEQKDVTLHRREEPVLHHVVAANGLKARRQADLETATTALRGLDVPSDCLSERRFAAWCRENSVALTRPQRRAWCDAEKRRRGLADAL